MKGSHVWTSDYDCIFDQSSRPSYDLIKRQRLMMNVMGMMIRWYDGCVASADNAIDTDCSLSQSFLFPSTFVTSLIFSAHAPNFLSSAILDCVSHYLLSQDHPVQAIR